MHTTFLDDVCAGRATPADIDDYIDRWHTDPTETERLLHEYLGMTWDEYRRWAADPRELTPIIDEYHRRSSVCFVPRSKVRRTFAD